VDPRASPQSAKWTLLQLHHPISLIQPGVTKNISTTEPSTANGTKLKRTYKGPDEQIIHLDKSATAATPLDVPQQQEAEDAGETTIVEYILSNIWRLVNDLQKAKQDRLPAWQNNGISSLIHNPIISLLFFLPPFSLSA
jgi:hypothetical protein